MLVAVLALGLVAVACGDDDDDDDNGGDAPASTRESDSGDDSDATQEADDEPTKEAGDNADDNGGGASGTLRDVESFEYELVFEGDIAGLAQAFGPGAGGAEGLPEGELKMTGAFAAPDRARLTVGIGDETLFGTIVIGDEQWVNFAGSWIGPTPADGPAGDSVLAFDFVEGFDQEGLNCDGDSEKVNGVDAIKCSIDSEDIAALQSLFATLGEDANPSDIPEDFEFEIWIAEDGGFPVRMSFSGTDPETDSKIAVTMNITNIGGDVTIEPPQT